MGSMNVMTSLKEKIAAKSATGSISGLPKKTPSRVHALLQEQLGVEEEQEEGINVLCFLACRKSSI